MNEKEGFCAGPLSLPANLGRLENGDGQLVSVGQIFEPNGGVWGQQGTISMPFGFTGEMEDDNNLVYLRSRYYSHDTGTFLSQDTMEGNTHDPMSLNRYAYAHGNPVNRVDPSGHAPVPVGSFLNSAMQSNPLLFANVVNSGMCLQVTDCNFIERLFGLCPTPEPFVTNTPPPPFVTNTPPPTATPLPTSTPIAISDVRRKAIVLAVMQEASGLTDQDRAVVVFVIFNREKFPDAFDTIEQALGGSQIAGGVLNGFEAAYGPNRSAQISGAYDNWYPTRNAGFAPADAFVSSFLASPPADFTMGAIQFSHAATPADAQEIARRIAECGEDVILGIIENAGVGPIINGPEMEVGAIGRTVYINMNYTLPIAPSGAPNCSG